MLRCPCGLITCAEHDHDLTDAAPAPKPEPPPVPSVPRGFSRRDRNGFPVFDQKVPRPERAPLPTCLLDGHRWRRLGNAYGEYHYDRRCTRCGLTEFCSCRFCLSQEP